uniref:Hyaluronidase n=2 Tax=Latimeria chalumnae TaxID=7897 RepID=H3A0D6_LATCH
MEAFCKIHYLSGIVVCMLSLWVAFIIPFCQTILQQAPPLVEESVFLPVWNAPTELCETNYGVSLDLRPFQYVGSPTKTATNQKITLFYKDRLGFYPYYDEISGESFNGGLPQLAYLYLHLMKAKEDVYFYIPSDQTGLAVIDWENWRPLWIRNWGSKQIYRLHSMELVQQRDLTLTQSEAYMIAKSEFENAAKLYMRNSLQLGKLLKPNRLWGYYLFPDCYNYDYKENPKNYTGRCPDIEIARNNKLLWLWEESTAIYPSVYLETSLRSSNNAALFARHRVQEALRIAALPNNTFALPVYVYARPVFTDSYLEYLSEVDLVNTIGEAAALGAAGIVLWGSLNFTQSLGTCLALDNYLNRILNPYIINVTLAAKLCSHALCQDNGTCMRKNWDASAYLHLNSNSFIITVTKHGNISVTGKPSIEDLYQLVQKFTCFCYVGRSCTLTTDLNSIRIVNDICISPEICIKVSSSSVTSETTPSSTAVTLTSRSQMEETTEPTTSSS